MNHRGWWLLLTFSLAVAGWGWYSGARWATEAARVGFEAGLAASLTTVREQAAVIEMLTSERQSVCVPDLWLGRCWWWDGVTRRPSGWPPQEAP